MGYDKGYVIIPKKKGSLMLNLTTGGHEIYQMLEINSSTANVVLIASKLGFKVSFVAVKYGLIVLILAL